MAGPGTTYVLDSNMENHDDNMADEANLSELISSTHRSTVEFQVRPDDDKDGPFFQPRFSVDHQSFDFGRRCEDAETAHWYCDQLKKALARTGSHSCSWTQDEDGNWNTECGGIFIFESGGPSENEAKWCLYCGGSLVSIDFKEGDESERWEPSPIGQCLCGGSPEGYQGPVRSRPDNLIYRGGKGVHAEYQCPQCQGAWKPV